MTEQRAYPPQTEVRLRFEQSHRSAASVCRLVSHDLAIACKHTWRCTRNEPHHRQPLVVTPEVLVGAAAHVAQRSVGGVAFPRMNADAGLSIAAAKVVAVAVVVVAAGKAERPGAPALVVLCGVAEQALVGEMRFAGFVAESIRPARISAIFVHACAGAADLDGATVAVARTGAALVQRSAAVAALVLRGAAASGCRTVV